MFASKRATARRTASKTNAAPVALLIGGNPQNFLGDRDAPVQVYIAAMPGWKREPGQVNISEATYELVKDETGLTFTPRGKVQAKGKEELEMYFVQRSCEVA